MEKDYKHRGRKKTTAQVTQIKYRHQGVGSESAGQHRKPSNVEYHSRLGKESMTNKTEDRRHKRTRYKEHKLRARTSLMLNTRKFREKT